MCDCCEINDYDPVTGYDDDGVDDEAVLGSCINCGHSPEEHGY